MTIIRCTLTLIDIHRRVADNYVDPVDESKLSEGAIDGMLGELDPVSVYIPPARQEDFDRMLEGSFKGVGIELNPRRRASRSSYADRWQPGVQGRC